jgi:hypothetical protein
MIFHVLELHRVYRGVRVQFMIFAARARDHPEEHQVYHRVIN